MENLPLLLQKCTLFNNKSLKEIAALLSKINYRIQVYKENEIVFSGEQLANTLGIILDGVVDVQKIFPSGKIVTVTTRRRFELLADAAIFAETQYYPGTISTRKVSKVFLIQKQELLNLFSLDQTIMLNFLCSVSNRIFALNHKIEILSLSSIQSKIAYFLIRESECRNSDMVILRFSKKSWSEHINVSRTSLSRELRQLAMEGLISFDKHKIQINNIKKLKELLLC